MRKPTLLALLSALLCYAAASLAQTASGGKGVTPSLPFTAGAGLRPVTHAVVIGISDYQDPAIPDLRFADRDAEAFADWLRSPGGGGLDGSQLKLLLNGNATAGHVAEALDGLVEQSKEGETALIYFSGHGDVERRYNSQPGFLLCWDAPSRVYMSGGTFSLAYLQEIVTTLSLQKKARVVVIADACHAGKLAGSQIGGAQATTASLASQYAGEVKILSCQPNEFSLEGEQWGGGRGVFSYHLVDALYGLADRNADAQVSLSELDRYLEDHVTAEAAPQRQIPLLLGDRSFALAGVNAPALAQWQQQKSAQPFNGLMPVSERGELEALLSQADSSLRERYRAFLLALKEKRFFGAPGADAESLYGSLVAEPRLAALQGSLKRAYAAALQDDAQQVLNAWLSADYREIDKNDRLDRYSRYPRQLERAAELLGKDHYLYKALMARKYLFEGYLIFLNRSMAYDTAAGRQSLEKYRLSLAFEPGLPNTHHFIAITYASSLYNLDSVLYYAQMANRLAPAWVFPLLTCSEAFLNNNQYERAKALLDQAYQIDSTNDLVLSYQAYWLSRQNRKAEALKLYQKIGAKYALSTRMLQTIGVTYRDLRMFPEAEEWFNRLLAMDSLNPGALACLGYIYAQTGRPEAGEEYLKKSLGIFPNGYYAHVSLADLYIGQNRLAEAEAECREALRFNPKWASAYYHLGVIALRKGRMDEARAMFEKCRAADAMLALAPYGLACYYAVSGNQDMAMEELRDSLEKGFNNREALQSNPQLASLRLLPAFDGLMKKYFPQAAKN